MAEHSETTLRMQSGFGNEFASEAFAGALPAGQNSPQHVPFGLYAEQLSATAFTAPRADNRRTWVYRVRPSAAHGRYELIESPPLLDPPSVLDRSTAEGNRIEPNRLRWDPLPIPTERADFVDGLVTMGATGDPRTLDGVTVYLYACNASMDRVFASNDGELLLVAQHGVLRIDTELGRMLVHPGHIAVIPRGLRFRVTLASGEARGYLCENHGQLLRLPELGPIGANGLANPRDFLSPVAWFDEDELDTPTTVVQKSDGVLWRCDLDHSPLDVVAWHGTNVPYTYDLAAFNTINTVSYDHPDPSIFTVLTSPSEIPGTANVDFVIFPPRWMVAEHTFRPPWFHRNVMSEFMGLLTGVYDAKATGFAPGGASLHNAGTAHGPDLATFERATNADLAPHRIGDTMAFMFETRKPIVTSSFARSGPLRQDDYDTVWNGFPRRFPTDLARRS